MKKTREELIKVYEDTEHYIEGHKMEFKSSTKHYGIAINETPIITVIDSDTVSAIIKYRQYGRLCVLNMASAKRAGGGVKKGEPTQEECLFRCSNLSHTINGDSYPLGDFDFIYTKNAVFFKDADYNEMRHIEADVITMPAINLNRNSYFDKEKNEWVDGIVEKPPQYDHIIKQKMRAMFSTAIENKVQTLILGAWGCGVFKNHPLDIAYAFRDVLVTEGYGYHFDDIIFAVINDENSTGNNYYYFDKILGNL